MEEVVGKKSCPHYPCHFDGQSCDFCYCPFYPCKLEWIGGRWHKNRYGKVWDCSGCKFIHEPVISDLLNTFKKRYELANTLDKIVIDTNCAVSTISIPLSDNDMLKIKHVFSSDGEEVVTLFSVSKDVVYLRKKVYVIALPNKGG